MRIQVRRRFRLIELNDFGAMRGCGACLFHWIQDARLMYGESEGIEVVSQSDFCLRRVLLSDHDSKTDIIALLFYWPDIFARFSPYSRPSGMAISIATNAVGRA